MLDELRQIAIFSKVVDHGSFRAAARELDLSPSVVSHHISQLEEKLGTALLYRSTRKLALTHDGEKLIEAARDMMAGMEASLADIKAQSDEPSGQISVALPALLILSPITDQIASFAAQYPKLQIRINFSDERRKLVDDGFDLAIRMAVERERAPNRLSLFWEKRYIVGAPSYLANHDEIASPADLGGHEWIEFQVVRNARFALRKGGTEIAYVQPRGRMSANVILSVAKLAKLGHGLAIIPDFLAEEGIATGTLKRVLPEWTLDPLEAYAEWPINAPKNGAARLLAKELQRG